MAQGGPTRSWQMPLVRAALRQRCGWALHGPTPRHPCSCSTRARRSCPTRTMASSSSATSLPARRRNTIFPCRQGLQPPHPSSSAGEVGLKRHLMDARLGCMPKKSSKKAFQPWTCRGFHWCSGTSHRTDVPERRLYPSWPCRSCMCMCIERSSIGTAHHCNCLQPRGGRGGALSRFREGGLYFFEIEGSGVSLNWDFPRGK